MAVIKSLVSALSTYSKIPMPSLKYKDTDGRFTLIFFPLVGVIIALFEYLWFLIGWKFEFEEYVLSLGYLLIPLFVTGGIHLDGFMDSMDAVHSYSGRERRLEILEDPHIGAFCVIKLLELAGIWFICFAVSMDYLMVPFIWGFIVSRILSAFSIATFPTAKESGMVYYTKSHSSKCCRVWLLAELLLCMGYLFYLYEFIIVPPFVAALLCLLYYKFKVAKDFGGITGDTAGCFLVMTETAWVAAIALTGLWRMF